MSIRIVFADLDGTLLDTHRVVSAFTRDVLRRLHTERPCVKFVVATGRPYQDVMESMKLLQLHPDYIISNNGAVVHQGETDKRVCQHTLRADVVRRVLALPLPSEPVHDPSSMAEATGSPPVAPVVAANLFREQDWVSTCKVTGMGRTYRPNFQPRVVADLPLANEYHEQVYSLFFYGPHEHLLPIERALRRDFAEDVTFSFSLPYILDVAPRAVDKATALRDVLKLLQLSPEDAAAFGDGMNDLPMLTAVGHGYVMANSLPELFAAAPHLEVIGSNADDGVAKKLLALFFP
ncbi:putative haloacid dehalogenase-like hydrolase [Leptomonas pyrrhocoris]|uniref:Putative haloacid dehalogenase-like hydrolase n=1 Tax=Leptomonas pyrrhocoris TaxID=157538 RepID=A0A0N0VHG3_LEPPY|nr:putative haloacid dehalogenase-like hydrolase [Leptomonas pyrrhocoris]KPA85361.1 putative haloacid dehalogenase-like hydrolase [Leptomonas pyrrhocoris]|eukprot:XP_015663800.1 putative haloacid dehalogenase-like hydrolase [Leptomonas pyrrhocoris]